MGHFYIEWIRSLVEYINIPTRICDIFSNFYGFLSYTRRSKKNRSYFVAGYIEFCFGLQYKVTIQMVCGMQERLLDNGYLFTFLFKFLTFFSRSNNNITTKWASFLQFFCYSFVFVCLCIVGIFGSFKLNLCGKIHSFCLQRLHKRKQIQMCSEYIKMQFLVGVPGLLQYFFFPLAMLLLLHCYPALFL